MNSHKFLCPRCGQSLEAEWDLVGEKVDCPTCKLVFTVPEPSKTASKKQVGHGVKTIRQKIWSRSLFKTVPILVLLFATLFFSVRYMRNPYRVIVPANFEEWEKSGLDKAVERLSSEKQRLFTAYTVRMGILSAFSGSAQLPEGKNIREILDEQKRWEDNMQEQQARQAVLASNLRQEQEQARSIMNDIITVTLIEIGFTERDSRREIYSDAFEISVGIENRTSREILGIRGVMVFKDIFGETMQRVRLSYDDGLLPNQSIVWRGTMGYNRFKDGDVKLRNTRSDRLVFEWEPDTYLFTDGTSMVMPR
jgi:hypothetical protein